MLPFLWFEQKLKLTVPVGIIAVKGIFQPSEICGQNGLLEKLPRAECQVDRVVWRFSSNFGPLGAFQRMQRFALCKSFCNLTEFAAKS